jgi:hypothetical protein
MARKPNGFSVGDKVCLISNPKRDGVIVWVKNETDELSVHFSSGESCFRTDRGIFKQSQLEKIKPKLAIIVEDDADSDEQEFE